MRRTNLIAKIPKTNRHHSLCRETDLSSGERSEQGTRRECLGADVFTIAFFRLQDVTERMVRVLLFKALLLRPNEPPFLNTRGLQSSGPTGMEYHRPALHTRFALRFQLRTWLKISRFLAINALMINWLKHRHGESSLPASRFIQTRDFPSRQQNTFGSARMIYAEISTQRACWMKAVPW